ncbi:MAG: hypothetical protein HKL87_06850, partial [Acidimicrobiaceae bacterium]|nr:hypothetical protein [Acidimicrobiaceae bacterium]
MNLRWITLAALVAASCTGLGIASPAGAALANVQWNPLATTGAPPADGGLMAYDAASHQMIFFGGGAVTPGNSYSNETWQLTGSSWTQLSPVNSPSPRQYSSMAYDPATGTIVLFGGSSGGTLSGHTWTWNGSTWSQVTTSTGPSPREGASLAYDPATGTMILFGGLDNSGGYLNDTWSWDGSSWSQMAITSPTSPSPRFLASLAYDPATQTMVLFGGNSAGTDDGDTWVLNTSAGYWLQVPSTPSPLPRNSASFVYDPATGTDILFGGNNPNQGLADTWSWSDGQWTQLSPTQYPSARYGAAMEYNPSLSEMELFGGIAAGSGLPLTDTLTLSATPNPPSQTTPSATNGQLTVNFTPSNLSGSGTVTSFEVFVSTTSGGENYQSTPAATCGAPATSCTVNGLTNGQTYYATVEAVNSVGASPPSNQESVTVGVAPSISAATITGTPSVGQTLTAHSSGVTGTPT